MAFDEDDIPIMIAMDMRPTRLPNGVWSRILCSECEQRFKKHDDFLIQFTRDSSKAVFEHNGTASIFDADPHRLKLAYLSVLYRAHLSSHTVCSVVNLGPYAEELRLILYNNTDASSTFEVFIRHLDFDHRMAMINLRDTKIDGVRMYGFYLPKFHTLIKVGRNPFPPPLKGMQLGAYSKTTAIHATEYTEQELSSLRELGGARKADIDKIYRRLWERKRTERGGSRWW